MTALGPTSAARSFDSPAEGVSDATGRKNLRLLIQLRWVAVLGQIVTIATVTWGLGIALPLDVMAAVLAGLIGFNVLSMLRSRLYPEISNIELFIALLVDVAILTVHLCLSGGSTNPFVFLYLLQVSLAAVLLRPWTTWLMVGISIVCLTGLAWVGTPLPLPPDHDFGLRSYYLQGMLLCFALNGGLLAFFITRINANLLARDAHLADLRQRAAEEDHVVRMGLLASGAANELGTPLATLAVILGDWHRMPGFREDPEMLQEVEEMQTQVARCKAIVSGILLSAGEARGESLETTTVRTFLDALTHEWRTTRIIDRFEYDNRFIDDQPMIADATLKQTICNILDNALEASSAWVAMEVTRQDDSLAITVFDRGPGFAPPMLAQLGKPYQSSKGRPGCGLGLFFVVNVARMLGGSLRAHNRPQGGAVVTFSLPLIAVTPVDPSAPGLDATRSSA